MQLRKKTGTESDAYNMAESWIKWCPRLDCLIEELYTPISIFSRIQISY